MYVELWRRRLNLIICYVSWTCAIVIVSYRFIVIDTIQEQIRYEWMALAAIMSVGIAITATMIRSRYKLVDTISDVFLAGVRTGRYEAKGDSSREGELDDN